MKHVKTILAIFVLIISVAIFTGCEKGPAEKAGEKIDETMDKAGDAVNDALGK